MWPTCARLHRTVQIGDLHHTLQCYGIKRKGAATRDCRVNEQNQKTQRKKKEAHDTCITARLSRCHIRAWVYTKRCVNSLNETDLGSSTWQCDLSPLLSYLSTCIPSAKHCKHFLVSISLSHFRSPISVCWYIARVHTRSRGPTVVISIAG